MLISRKYSQGLIILILNLTVLTPFSFSAEVQDKDFGIEYETLGIQFDLMEMLYEQNIPFYIDQGGVIRIKKEFRQEVNAISEGLEKRPSTQINDSKHALVLAFLLKSKSITYDMRTDPKSEVIHMFWDNRDDLEVREIINNEFKNAIVSSHSTGKLVEFSGR